MILGGPGDRPAGGDLLELRRVAPSGPARVDHPEMTDLAGTLAEAAIDPIVDDQCTADPAADGHVKQR